MDVHALISAIYKRPSLWDKRHKHHTNRTVSEKRWKEIAEELNTEESLVRKKWKYLRDNFSVEYSKTLMSQSGDAAVSSSSSKWQYLSKLMFLKDIVTPRAPFGGSNRLSRSSYSNDLGLDHSPVSVIVSEQSLDAQDPPTDSDSQSETVEELEQNINIQNRQPRLQKRKRRGEYDDYYSNDQLETETEADKIQYVKVKRYEREDEDLMFYKCLLPHVRLIPQHLKLEYQCRIQSVIQEFAYDRQSASSGGGSHQAQEDYKPASS